MSILQEYQTIRNTLRPGEAEAMDKYVGLNPQLSLSDIYYKEEVYNGFNKWWQEQLTLDRTHRERYTTISNQKGGE